MARPIQPVLDVCCGGRMFYFDKNDPRVLFCDNRDFDTNLCDGREYAVHPDVKCDFTRLPFVDNSYSVVVFDPPHLKRHDTGKPATGWQFIKYGELHDDWPQMLAAGFRECFRVLKPNGVLIFKWSEIDIPLSEVLKCTKEKPVFGHKSGKLNKTHWVCFVKEEK